MKRAKFVLIIMLGIILISLCSIMHPKEETVAEEVPVQMDEHILLRKAQYTSAQKPLTELPMVVDSYERQTHLQFTPSLLEPGLHRVNGRFYYVDADGTFRQTPGVDTENATRFYCTGKDGEVKILSRMATMADGRCFLIQDGDIIKVIGLHEFFGKLYFFKPDFSILCNDTWKTLQFGPDGAYTSGNDEIDTYVDELIHSVTDNTMNRQEKLYACYAYVFDHNEYQSNNLHVPRGADETEWTEDYMLRLIERGKGNCYCYASEMYYIAKRLGYYDAHAVSGGVMLDNDHGWLELIVEGVPTVTDPELESKWFSTPGNIFLTPYKETPWTYYLK